jgi:hypothetical protein
MAKNTSAVLTPSNYSIHKPLNKTCVNPDSIEAMTPETDRMVHGTFVNVEYPGQTAKVCCRYYKGQNYFEKVFEDGEDYTIPLSVARHINERCFHEQHSFLQDERGQPLKSGKKVFRYKFHSSSF